MDYKMYLVLGDWSDDGHGKYEKVLVTTNYKVKDVQDAYKKSCKTTGISFNHNEDYTECNRDYKEAPKYQIATEYESGLYLNKEVIEVLNKFNIKISDIVEDKWGSRERFVELWFDFVKISLPDLEYKLVNVKDDIPCINGYWNKNLNVQFGYGLFY